MKFIKAFLKKYSALILPMSLLLAGILLFIPTMLAARTANSKKDATEALSRDLDRLISETPPKREAEVVKQALERFQKEVETVEVMALQTTQRELIKYGLFPKSADTSSQIYLDFGKRYRAAVESLITDRLNALDAPSDAEIKAQSGQPMNPMYPGLGGGEMMIGGQPGQPQTQQNPMVDALCQARAEKITMYANPNVLYWYNYWESFQYSGAENALRDCWFSQAAYWIYEDVVATIEAMNDGYFTVADAKVKRFLGVSFQRPVTVLLTGPTSLSPAGNLLGPMGGVRMSSGSGDLPAYVLAGRPSPLVSKPWTGRVGNEELDVIHFAVSVIVDNRYVQTFLKELCSAKVHTFREGFAESGKQQEARHNQITVLESTFSSVDKQDPIHANYRYGTAAVMRVDLVCEYLFYRQAYDEIKPEPIKVFLGQSEQAPSPNQGPGMPGMPGVPGMPYGAM